jgi:hypothetical protein
MKQVIEVRGKVKQVLKFMQLLSSKQGHVTLEELAKEDRPIKVDLRKP